MNMKNDICGHVCLCIGAKQQSCKAPVVFLSFLLLLIINPPLKSMEAHKTVWSKVERSGTQVEGHANRAMVGIWG